MTLAHFSLCPAFQSAFGTSCHNTKPSCTMNSARWHLFHKRHSLRRRCFANVFPVPQRAPVFQDQDMVHTSCSDYREYSHLRSNIRMSSIPKIWAFLGMSFGNHCPARNSETGMSLQVQNRVDQARMTGCNAKHLFRCGQWHQIRRAHLVSDLWASALQISRMHQSRFFPLINHVPLLCYREYRRGQIPRS